MVKIKLFSGKDVVRKLGKVGWIIARQKGSHVMMIKENYTYTLTIPQHRELGIGILRKIVKQAGITIEEFNKL